MSARQIARGGMITGVSIALLYIATFLSVASWAACMLIGFIPELFFLVGERKLGCLVYLSTSVLALFLLPDKGLAILYAGLFGLYTVLRFFIEQIPNRILRWGCKFIFANIWIFIVFWGIRVGFIPQFSFAFLPVPVILFLGGNLILVYYDLCLSRIFPNLFPLAQRFYNAIK